MLRCSHSLDGGHCFVDVKLSGQLFFSGRSLTGAAVPQAHRPAFISDNVTQDALSPAQVTQRCLWCYSDTY